MNWVWKGVRVWEEDRDCHAFEARAHAFPLV